MSAATDDMLAAAREIMGRINSIQERISTVRIIYTSAHYATISFSSSQIKIEKLFLKSCSIYSLRRMLRAALPPTDASELPLTDASMPRDIATGIVEVGSQEGYIEELSTCVNLDTAVLKSSGIVL